MDDILTKHVYTYKGEMFTHRVQVRVNLSKDDYLEINDWIEENAKEKWTDFYTNKGCYFVEFELEEDAVAFKLRWI